MSRKSSSLLTFLVLIMDENLGKVLASELINNGTIIKMRINTLDIIVDAMSLQTQVTIKLQIAKMLYVVCVFVK